MSLPTHAHRVGHAAQQAAGPAGAPQGSGVGDAMRGVIDAALGESIAADAMTSVVDSALAPFEAPPADESPVETATRLVTGAMGLLSLPGDLANTALAMATAGLAKLLPSFPAATMLCPHLGTPHVHTHPPALPFPLPSFGVLLIGGCQSVHVNGVPAARAGDLGVAITCGSLAPPFEVFTGSSKVFFGGGRAARMFDITKHCQPSVAPARLPIGEIVMGAASLAVGAVGVAQSLGAADESRQQADDAAAESVQQSTAAAAAAASAAGHAAAAATAGSEAAAQAHAQAAADAQADAQAATLAAAEAASMSASMSAMAAGQSLGAATQAAQAIADAAALAASLLMGKDPGAPPCFGAVLLGHPNVLVGGFPMPPWMAVLGGLFKLLGKLKHKVRNKALSDKIHNWINGKMPNKTRLRTLLHKAVCFVTGHPVDVVTGRLLTDAVDFELPGPIPLTFERNYDSAWSDRDSPLGHGWSHTLDQAVWHEPGQLVLRAEDGRELEIPLPPHVDAPELVVFEPKNRLTLRHLGERRWRISGPDGLDRDFAPVPGGDPQHSRLIRIADPVGHEVRLEYDDRARLAWVHDSAGRRVRLVHDDRGRLVQVLLPHPDHDGLVTHVRYEYDADDLVAVLDVHGHALRHAYDNHRMTRETLRGGLSFYFEYDGWGADARCARTWGDGGIYDHRLVHDAARRTTIVTNSCGEATVYRADERGLVVELTDARGAVTRYEYDEHLRTTAEVDPLGHATRYAYDARGNCCRVVGPDGATVEVTHDARDLPVAAVDAVGGRWAWSYDDRRRLLARTDPLGRTTRYRHGERLPLAVVDPAGHELRLTHDAAGDLIRVDLPNGGVQRWRHDRRGRLRESTDVMGNVQRRVHDLSGRLVHVHDPDGDERSLEYDPDGNLVRVRDRHRDIALTYTGMHRLATRREAGTTVGFRYDTEGRLRAITNEHGEVYRFDLDPTGEVSAEYGFDGIRRLYTRDLAGRVREVLRAGGLRTRFTHDPAGRLTEILHSDRSGDRFAYRPDGEMIEATHLEPGRDDVVVRFERDLLGRVTREWQGEHWIDSTHGPDGLRTSLRSSLGARQQISRDVMGDVTRIETDGWSADFTRDLAGLEIDRKLPGGVHVTWRRDSLGRPVEHTVTRAPRPRLDGTPEHGGAPQLLHRRAYTWDPGLRLRRIDDLVRGPVDYVHDERGYLVSATHADGRVELRLPDAVGNLFRRPDRSDRRYGPAGQLLEADGTTYDYDPEGNLIKKTEPTGATWHYKWTASGTLAEVLRPDGHPVRFAYDALSRRISKEFGGRRTGWLWDGDVPLHEWTADTAIAENEPQRVPEAYSDSKALAQGFAGITHRPEILTWLFDTESFAPLARLSSREHRGRSVITDHLGTPAAMLDLRGDEVWSTELDSDGRVRHATGERNLCPFRFPGQYEDAETGLSYNRFRYFNPETGQYISQDPASVFGGLEFYAYVHEPNTWYDPLGLVPVASLPDEPGVYIITNGKQSYVGSSGIGKQGMRKRTANGHPKAQKLLSQPGTKVQYIRVSLDGITDKSHRNNILRHFEEIEYQKQKKRGYDMTLNDKVIQNPSKRAQALALINQYGVRASKRRTTCK